MTSGAEARPPVGVDEYLTTVRALARLQPSHELPLDDVLGRVLAEDAFAGIPVPSFDNSAIDGYAVRIGDLADLPAELEVSQDVPAGAVPTDLAPGSAARIMTGAPIPPGADVIVGMDDVRVDGDKVKVLAHGPEGQHIRHAGESVQLGGKVLSAGATLTERHVAAAAAAGLAHLKVRRRPRVAVVTAGDELVQPGYPLSPGRIYDSNQVWLNAWLPRHGAKVVSTRAVTDDVRLLVANLDSVAPRVDLIVLAAGVATGTHDIVRDALLRNGATLVTVKMQPGRPQGCGLWRGTPLLALPGNPIACSVATALFVRAFLDKELGREPAPGHLGRVAQGWESVAGRRQFMPVAYVDAEAASGEATAPLIRPVTPDGTKSHLVTALADADAIAVVPEDVTEVGEGMALRLIEW